MGPTQEPLTSNDRLLSRTRSSDYRRNVINAAPDEKVNKQCSRKLSSTNGNNVNNKHTALRRTSHGATEDRYAEQTVNHRRKLYADEADVFERATRIVM